MASSSIGFVPCRQCDFCVGLERLVVDGRRQKLTSAVGDIHSCITEDPQPYRCLNNLRESLGLSVYVPEHRENLIPNW